MPCDDNPGGDLAVDPGEVVQEPAELACANCGPAGDKLIHLPFYPGIILFSACACSLAAWALK